MLNKFRYYQEEANLSICNNLLHNDKCIIKMFCGTGKSLLMRKCDIISNKQLVVFVFPSLSLIEQFYDTYLCDFQKKNILKISSESESTTNPTKIQKFLSKLSKKIICITYQSYNVLIENLNDKKIDICIYDEAHHAVGQTYQKLIFENKFCLKQLFFTATPKNSNGIVMYSKDNNAINMCGDLVYDYSYLRGSLEGYLNPFDLMIDLYTENTNKSIYEAIARCILTTKNNRVLTFHSDVNTDRNTSVINFVNNSNFETIFNNIQQKEFPEMFQYFKKINILSLDASINMKTRKQILEDFDNTSNEDIFIICSCETIGEGIDTKNANMCVFVDPKTSYVKIIQNIGRIVRKVFNENKPNSSVLIPCYVDKSKYEGCKDDPVKCDEIIRQEMKSNNGDFNDVLNVISALKQEDEDLYDLLLNYSNKYSFQEIETNLNNQNYEILENDDLNGDLLLSLEYLLNENENEKNIELDFENYEDCDNDEEIIEMVAEENNVCIEIHSNSLENPIKYYNCENKENGIIRLFKNDENEDNEDEGLYKCIIRKNNLKRINKDAIHFPNKNNKFKLNIHSNSDIQVLWNIKNDLDLIDKISSCVIDCQVIDKWLDNLEKLKSFIDLNKKTPTYSSKNKEEKPIGKWFDHQKQNYKNNKNFMKYENKKKLWEDFLEEYKEYYISNQEKWYNNFENLKSFIDLHKKRPSSKSKKEEEEVLGIWLTTQKRNYKNNEKSMKDEDKKTLFKDFLEEYQDYFIGDEEKWYNNLEKLKSFIHLHKKRPNSLSKNEEEKLIGRWLVNQTKNYKNNFEGMKDVNRRQLWEEFIEKYKEYFISDEKKWQNDFKNLKKFIDLHKKTPNYNSKNKNEKYLGRWLGTQKQNYKNNKFSMEDEDKKTLFKDFLEEYQDYFISDEEKWYNNLEKLKSFIHLHKKRPNSLSKNEEEKLIGRWLDNQKKNYKNNENSMKDENRRQLWRDFLEEYQDYFISDEEKWYNNFENLKNFIDLHKKRPNSLSKNEEEKLIGRWLVNQTKNYNDNNFSMKDVNRRQLWEDFMEEYQEYLMSDDEIWLNKLEKLKSFIHLHKKRPTCHSNNKEEKGLGHWLIRETINYKNNENSMKDENIRQLWEEFIEKYKEYSMSNEEKWYNNFENLKSFIDLHKKRPSSKSKNEEEEVLGIWLTTQKRNYKNNEKSMKDEDKKTLFKDFLEEYQEYLMSDEEKWYNNFENLKKFINLNKRPPNNSKCNKNKEEKLMGKWFDHQKQNYKNNKFSMKDENRRQIWKEFFEEYKEYFNNNNNEKVSETSSIKDEESDEEEEIIIKVKKPVIKNMDLNKGSILKSSTTNSKKSKNKKERVKTEISILHQRYKTLTSNNLHNEFKNDEKLWINYHKIAEENEKTFPENEIPRNKIIEELEKIKTKRTKKVIDMGCGKAYISKHFENDIRFDFINYDHISINDKIISCDISKLPLEDDSIEICILCLSMWGSNCKEYIKEAERILESNGKLYIIEPTKRWSNKDENGIIIQEGEKLKELLEENRFQIMKEEIKKFVFYECIKN